LNSERTIELNPRTFIRKVNFIIFILLIAAGTVLDFDIRQKTILGVAGMLSFWAALTGKEYISYGINLLLGLMLIFSAFFL